MRRRISTSRRSGRSVSAVSPTRRRRPTTTSASTPGAFPLPSDTNVCLYSSMETRGYPHPSAAPSGHDRLINPHLSGQERITRPLRTPPPARTTGTAADPGIWSMTVGPNLRDQHKKKDSDGNFAQRGQRPEALKLLSRQTHFHCLCVDVLCSPPQGPRRQPEDPGADDASGGGTAPPPGTAQSVPRPPVPERLRLQRRHHGDAGRAPKA